MYFCLNSVDVQESAVGFLLTFAKSPVNKPDPLLYSPLPTSTFTPDPLLTYYLPAPRTLSSSDSQELYFAKLDVARLLPAPIPPNLKPAVNNAQIKHHTSSEVDRYDQEAEDWDASRRYERCEQKRQGNNAGAELEDLCRRCGCAE